MNDFFANPADILRRRRRGTNVKPTLIQRLIMTAGFANKSFIRQPAVTAFK